MTKGTPQKWSRLRSLLRNAYGSNLTGIIFFCSGWGGEGEGEWSLIGGGRLREWLHMVQQQLTIVYTCIHRDTTAYFNKEGVLGDSLKPLFTKVQ